MPKVVKNADGQDVAEWTFQCDPPTGDAIGGRDLAPIVVKLGTETLSFEVLCNHLEQKCMGEWIAQRERRGADGMPCKLLPFAL